ncbi:MAG: HAD family hydrolase [Micropruina sp.]
MSEGHFPITAPLPDRWIQAKLRSERRRGTALYPGVLEALTVAKSAGVSIVAYTESLAYWTTWRIKHTGLDGVIDVLYSAPDHDLPRGKRFEEMRSQPDASYDLNKTEHRHVPRGVLKPNAEVLLAILNSVGREPHEAVYIGDSLMKDIAMAQVAQVTDVHARYGEAQQHAGYDLLRRVTHWTDEDVERERAHVGSIGLIRPTHTCEHEFAEVLPVLGLA